MVLGMLYGAITTPSPIRGLWVSFVLVMLAGSITMNIITYKEDGKGD